MLKKSVTLLFIFLLALFTTISSVTAEENSIYDIAKANGDFTQLVAAVDANDLGATLDGAGSFTVFAPNGCSICSICRQWC